LVNSHFLQDLTKPYLCKETPKITFFLSFFFFFIVILGFELRAYTLSHSTSPFFDEFF
jgi:hypothetical protein